MGAERKNPGGTHRFRDGALGIVTPTVRVGVGLKERKTFSR
jgi:hypothetical protein